MADDGEYVFEEETVYCKCCSGETPIKDLDEDGDCPDCQKGKENED